MRPKLAIGLITALPNVINTGTLPIRGDVSPTLATQTFRLFHWPPIYAAHATKAPVYMSAFKDTKLSVEFPFRGF
ncbi:hypothetical protein ANO14919_053720 [Xylariales sp. No.14919]|nr:hypothetical protein ANO14919_053720 [Xylariales sp. No.14919]